MLFILVPLHAGCVADSPPPDDRDVIRAVEAQWQAPGDTLFQDVPTDVHVIQPFGWRGAKALAVYSRSRVLQHPQTGEPFSYREVGYLELRGEPERWQSSEAASFKEPRPLRLNATTWYRSSDVDCRTIVYGVTEKPGAVTAEAEFRSGEVIRGTIERGGFALVASDQSRVREFRLLDHAGAVVHRGGDSGGSFSPC